METRDLIKVFGGLLALCLLIVLIVIDNHTNPTTSYEIPSYTPSPAQTVERTTPPVATAPWPVGTGTPEPLSNMNEQERTDRDACLRIYEGDLEGAQEELLYLDPAECESMVDKYGADAVESVVQGS
jgi:hypothetical protein